MTDSNKTLAIVIGKESVGKTELISSLTGTHSKSSNFRGTTVACEIYENGNISYIDTPGILRSSETESLKITLEHLEKNENVLLLVSATHIDSDLSDILPLLKDKQGAIALTFWDMATKSRSDATDTVERLKKALDMNIIPVDSRNLSEDDKKHIESALLNPAVFPSALPEEKAGWIIEPGKNIFDIFIVGQVLSLLLLFMPAWIAVQYANAFADWLYDDVEALFAPMLKVINNWPQILSSLFGGTYGFVAMVPYLFLYAVPTVVVFAVILSIYKTTGIVDRLTVALHPIMRHFGLAGRDLVRVIMGFGCNVPAVINTRACSISSRGPAICAVGFGAACSYQLPSTVAVFAAAKMKFLAVPYLIILGVTTLIYLRITTNAESREKTNKLMIEGRDFLQVPKPAAVWREVWGVMSMFFFQALPVFFIICAIASMLEFTGILKAAGIIFGPVMKVFNLPADASLTVILASIRKDGILLLTKGNVLAGLTSVQVMTAVYLAGVFFPCLVTLVSVVKEMKYKFALKMVGKQALGAVVFSLAIAWGGIVFANVFG
ncbi:MAG: ferrous iron transporter B [Desulfobacteraceae bacterium]|nr:ferrous iron transporter B [Desulfobacteraceae bacterium]